MAGGIANIEISQINEDVDDTCAYCLEEKSTAAHVVWICPHFHGIRYEHDPLLPKVPVKSAMQANGEKTYWGQVLDGDLD